MSKIPTPDSQRRLALSLLAGVGAAGALAGFAPWQLVILVGWDAAAACYLTLVWNSIRGLDAVATKRIATRDDDSRAAVDIVLLLASAFSLIGVVAGLAKAEGDLSALMVVSGATVVLSWLTVHSTFMLRYARLYYSTDGSGGAGIDFNDDCDPDFSDFAYLAFTVGMTFQVSDSKVTNRVLRRTISRHALLSYLFGTVIIGVTINVVGSLIG